LKFATKSAKALPIALTMGDPAGIAPEITAKAWQTLRHQETRFFVIAEPEVISKALDEIKMPPPRIIARPVEASAVFEEHLPILPLELAKPAVPGRPDSANGAAVVQSIEAAVGFCQNGQASGIVTNPIAKSVLYEAGFSFPGHTEFLGSLSRKFTEWEQPHGPVMMLCGGGLRVALVSIHTALANVPAQITTKRVEQMARVLQRALQRDFGLSDPKIAMCGLNPHAGEDANMGTEERDILNPLAVGLRTEGIRITDAMPADTLFREEVRNSYDAVLAMYHDQGLIPVKTLDFHGGTNVTLGLPFVRVSPDHGTGFDIAGKAIARPDSLVAALSLATDLAHQRDQFNARN